jgi:hypothetical protein
MTREERIDRVVLAICSAEIPTHGSHLMACSADLKAVRKWAEAALDSADDSRDKEYVRADVPNAPDGRRPCTHGRLSCDLCRWSNGRAVEYWEGQRRRPVKMFHVKHREP